MSEGGSLVILSSYHVYEAKMVTIKMFSEVKTTITMFVNYILRMILVLPGSYCHCASSPKGEHTLHK